MYTGGGSHHLPPIGNQHVNPLFSANSRRHRNGWRKRRTVSPLGLKQPYSTSAKYFSNSRFTRFNRRDEVPRYVSPRSTKRKKSPIKDRRKKRKRKSLRIGMGSIGKPKSKSLPTDILRKTFPERTVGRKKRRRRKRNKMNGKSAKEGEEGDPKYPSLVTNPPPSFHSGIELFEEDDLTQSFPEEDMRKALRHRHRNRNRNHHNKGGGLAVEGKNQKRNRSSSIPIPKLRSSSKPKQQHQKKKKLVLEEHPQKSKIYRENDMYRDVDQAVDTYYSEKKKEIEEMIENQSSSSSHQKKDSSSNNSRKRKRRKRKNKNQNDNHSSSSQDEHFWIEGTSKK